MSEGEIFRNGLSLGLIIGAATVGLVFVLTAKSYRYAPPCGYGAAETLVREQNGAARIVCACPAARTP